VFFLCVVFGVIGAVPLGLGILVRTRFIRAYAAEKTAALIASQLGVSARYDVRVRLWPMVIALDNLVVDASDGGTPFLSVERVALRPRPFSLLAGQFDVGDVEIVGPRVRAVVKDGALQNLSYKLPASSDNDTSSTRPPLSSLEITDARVDLTVDGLHVDATQVDLDLQVEQQSALEISLHTGESVVQRVHPVVGREAYEDAVDEDRICRLDARVRVDGRRVTIRRLTLQGSADFDPDPGSLPSCSLRESDFRVVDLRLGAVHLNVPQDGPIQADGRVHARLPVALVHRFLDLPPTSGAITLDLEGDYDGVARLPSARGHVSADRPGLDGKVFSSKLDLDVSTTPAGAIKISKLVAHWADGVVTAPDVTIEPFVKGVPLTAGPIQVEGIELPGLLRDLGVHPQAHVAWTLEKGRFEHFRGTLSPLMLEGPLSIATRNFEIFDRPTTDPLRGHMMGVREGTVRGTFVVNGQARSAYKFPGVILSNFTIDTPKSRVHTTVSLGFASVLDVEVRDGTQIDLTEISPLTTIPLAGVAMPRVSVRGPMGQPKISGDVAIKDFFFADMPVGDIESAKVAFEPFVLDLTDVRLKHGRSRLRSPLTRIAFDKGATVLIDSDIDTREAPHLYLRDLFEVFHLDKDPRFADIEAAGSGTARIHFALGGKEDRCGEGLLDVKAHLDLSKVSLFGERFPEGAVDLDMLWDDRAAGTSGMRIDLRSLSLRKGTGSLLATATVRHGGALQGRAIGSGVPIDALDAFGGWGKAFDGTVSAVVDIGGTLSAPEVIADASVSRVRIGPSSLPPSRLRVSMEPKEQKGRAIGRTRCGNELSAPFDQAEYDKDLSSGIFRVSGGLFDGQIQLDDVRITQQRHKVMTGKAAVRGLDLGTLANLIPGVAFAGAPPKGALSATLDVRSLPFDAPARGDLTLAVERFEVEREGNRLSLMNPSGPIELQANELRVPELKLKAQTGAGLAAGFTLGGAIHRVMTSPDVDASLRVDPIDLSRLGADIDGIDRAAGKVEANLRIAGPLSALRYSGAAHLRDGELDLTALPVPINDIAVDVEIAGGDARLKRAVAKIGGGTIRATGRVPLRGAEAGEASASIVARGVKLPIADGINVTADAELEAGYRPSGKDEFGRRSLPDIKGTVSLTSFSYTRPIALNLNLSQLGRSQRTDVDSYDPENDVVHFNINLVSPRPLRFSNNLVDMELSVAPPGLVLSGTNQRFGARGMLRIQPDSKLRLRSTEFVVREGAVRFEDPLKIAPKVDVRAQAEYRRYATTQAASGQAAPGAADASSGAALAATSGVFRITLHASGDVENLKMNLSSEPSLSEEDIVLLLTLGVTRAELNREGVASSVGGTVGLEALSALTGADKAVKTIVPLIDEFRFGTGYSSRTGRTEPTVTLGKRITDNLRATVTTGITENREVRSNIEWKLGRRMSVQGSYDNLNNVSSTPFGNVGVDLRWRLEFE